MQLLMMFFANSDALTTLRRIDFIHLIVDLPQACFFQHDRGAGHDHWPYNLVSRIIGQKLMMFVRPSSVFISRIVFLQKLINLSWKPVVD